MLYVTPIICSRVNKSSTRFCEEPQFHLKLSKSSSLCEAQTRVQRFDYQLGQRVLETKRVVTQPAPWSAWGTRGLGKMSNVLIMQQVNQPLEVNDQKEIARSEVQDVRVNAFSD